MRLSLEEVQKMSQEHLRAPRLQLSGPLPNFASSVDLLPHLAYNPTQRDQGACGDCWQWAGTGVMEIALDVQQIAHDRLSVQLLNSCSSTRNCCDGGWLEDVTSFYAGLKLAIPWANTNAFFSSGWASCANAPCGSIALSPSYAISNISTVAIATWDVGQAQAIADIKSALSQSNAVWFAFFMANDADWSEFFSFWDTQPETAVWTNFYCGLSWYYGAGHAVLCVGYDDSNPTNRYWVMLNSWGTTPGRPNGLFRVSMDLDYDCSSDFGHALFWQTLDLRYVPVSGLPVITGPPQNQTVPAGAAVSLEVAATGTRPLAYFWNKDSVPIASGTNASYRIAAARPEDSGYYSVTVSNRFGAVVSSAALLTVVSIPANDQCSGAIPILTSTYTATQSTLAATSVGDPIIYCSSSGANGVWYQYTPLTNGMLTVDTYGSSFDTVLAVYSGSCAALQPEACNDDTTMGLQSAISLYVSPGVTYYILAAGFWGATGNLVLHSTFSPEQNVFLPMEAESATLIAPMTIASDPLASNGSYIYSPTNSGDAYLYPTILMAGNYVLWCRILATNFNADSFFVSVDYDTPLIYDAAEHIASTNWQWTRLIGRTNGDPVVHLEPRLFYFDARVHELCFSARDPNTKLDRILITNNTNFVPVIGLEAEAGAVTSPMAVYSDPQASHGRYVGSSVAQQGQVALTVGIPAAGQYWVWCRVLATNWNADSFWVSMDGGPELVYDTAEGSWSNRWQWTRLIGRASDAPVNFIPRVFALSQSNHTLVFREREANSRLDRVLLTADPNFVPQNRIDYESGTLRLTVFSEPQRTNVIQITPTLNPPAWSNAATRIADWNGFFVYEDPVTGRSRFYRVLLP